MKNELMIEKDLMRDLTVTEKALLTSFGTEKFITKYLGMTEAEYRTLQAIRRILSAYCTQTEDYYDEALADPSYAKYLPLVEMTLDCIHNDIVKQIDENKKSAKPQLLDTLLNGIPESEKVWVEFYNKLVKDNTKLMDIVDDAESYDDKDEMVGELLDTIKDCVVDACIEKLHKEDTMILPKAIRDEVIATLWGTEDNIQIRVVDNTLTVKFK